MLITGADSFTPDGRLIMNESAEVRVDLSTKKKRKTSSNKQKLFRLIIISLHRVPMVMVSHLPVVSVNTWQN
jgi:hypothetical protein